MNGPLVSVGIPVRNGGAVFERALSTVREQTYRNLEIFISDNASDDGTSELCRQAAADDSRIRYIRHDTPLSALGNLRLAFEGTTGQFFMWAAHDDLRTLDYVEVLVGALLAAPDAGLAFADLWLFHDYDDLHLAMPLTRIRGTNHGGLRDRLLFPWRSCLPIYGLFRREVLAGFDGWDREEFGGDMAIIGSVAASSEILHVPGPRFYYWGADHEAVRAARKDREKVPERRWRYVRLNWAIADAVARATNGRSTPTLFAYLHLMYWWWRSRGVLTRALPLGMVETWRRHADSRRRATALADGGRER